ncbi:hypothetical protein [Helicobacter pylori]|nr:hypothetical protein [Helicobacter pylori]
MLLLDHVLIGFVVYYGCALIPKKRLRYSLEWLFIGSGCDD